MTNIEERIRRLTAYKANIQLTIGIQTKEKRLINVYGHRGQKLEHLNQRYEIGSLTKVMTASLLAKFIAANRISLTDSIANYFPELEQLECCPTVQQLVTHTSGYPTHLPFTKREYIKVLLQVLLGGENPFYQKYSKEAIIQCLTETRLSNSSYQFQYSNINYIILGQLISRVASEEFVTLMNEWLNRELKLKETHFLNDHVLVGYNSFGQKQPNWIWDKNDTAIAAGGLYSSADDLLNFTQWHHSETIPYLSLTHHKLSEGTKHDDMALGWKNPKGSSLFWHNGGTGCFSSFLGINKKVNKSVVILSNYRSFQLDSLGLTLLESPMLR